MPDKVIRPKKRCDICDIGISHSNWSKHVSVLNIRERRNFLCSKEPGKSSEDRRDGTADFKG